MSPNSKFIKPFFILLLLSALSFRANATHNIAGEITYTPIGDPRSFTYRITLVTYTDNKDGKAAHREEVFIDFGDGTGDTVDIKQGKIPVNPAGANMWKNIYETTHSYPGDGCYIISFNDPNRVAGVVNFLRDQSVDIPFFVQSQLCISSSFGSPPINHSPYLNEPPVSFGCVGKLYSHNPSAYDPDGDSLVYELVAPMKGKNTPVLGYVDPDDPRTNGGQPNGTLTLDSESGQITWDVPQRSGFFNIAIRITEYRKTLTPEGDIVIERIGYIVRDMQIRIEVCINNPPIITPVKDTCVVAGSDNIVLNIPIEATDPDNCNGNSVTLTASGGPFEVVKSPADDFGENVGYPDVTKNFSWRIDCSHIRKQPYQIVLNATDNACGDTGRYGKELSDIEFFNVKVIGPEPTNPDAEALGNGVKLKWEKPACNNMVLYKIYRKAAPSGWDPELCEVGIRPGLGFKEIKRIDDIDQLEFYDDNNGRGLFHGVTYCYRITALYKAEGQFEQVEGKASIEVCALLKKDVPVLTHVTVDSTHKTAGEVTIMWSSPDPNEITQYPPPYEYRISQSTDLRGNNPQLIHTITASSFAELEQITTHSISGLNTLENPHSYQIDFLYTQEDDTKDSVGAAKSASSPFLVISPSFRELTLEVKHDVPWTNTEYTIYRQNRLTKKWDSIGTTDDGIYVDQSLIIGATYCYKVRTTGSFNATGFVDPIINYSQESCSIPIDTVRPCPPTISAEADCELFENSLAWTFDDFDCAFDVVSYNLYFQNRGRGKFEKVTSFDGDEFENNFLDIRDTLKFSLAGCYRVSAVDSYFNESPLSNIVCVDNCPEYILPNVMTPNGDGINDVFVPFPYRFVDSIDFVVFNRWGQEVFKTNDPKIEWDGKDMKSGKPLNTGVYYYVAYINEIRLKTDEVTRRMGTIHILH